MNAFDIAVLVIISVAAIGGFMRGFVQEVMSLAAWGVAILAIYFLHTDLTALLFERMDSPVGASILAFMILLILPYAAVRIIAGMMGKAARNSLLGPIDRVLGFGFGAVKGVVVAVMAFSLMVLGYDSAWGDQGRPAWMTTARSYTFINASAEMMVQLIKERHERLMEGTEEVEGA